MAESLQKLVEDLQAEINNLQDQVNASRPTAPKDLSLISLIPKWSGTENSVRVKEFFESVESVATIGNWSETDKKQITVLKLTEVAKAFYSSNPELHDTSISWENFKANFLHRFRDVRNDQYHFMQLQTAKQQKHETPREFLDRCRSLAMNTVPKVEDPVLQKFHYNQAQRMLLSTFIAGLVGNLGQMCRFHMPATVDLALQIATTVFEAEAQEKRNSAFFSNSETHRKVEATLVSPGRPLEDQSTDRLLVLAQTRRMQAGSSVSKIPARLAAKGNCFVSSVGNQDILLKIVFQINLPLKGTRERISTQNRRKRESQAALTLKLLVETPIVRKTCS